MNRVRGWGFAFALLLATPALAGELTSIEPAELEQGDTALLTLRGKDIPEGVLAIEFFPQHVAVVSILSQSRTEVTAQVKVPALAPPGAYNALVFNQLGEEAFGKGLLTITSTVLTPVFKNYDPKVIAQADAAFALLLTGDAITPEAAAHLSADWRQGEQALGGMYTTFSYAGGAVMCAVTGRLPTGRVTGRIKMDDRPIYQLEVEIRGPTTILGHSPTSMPSAPGVQKVRLIGADFSAPFLSRISATLRLNKKQMLSEAVVLRDAATAELEFPGPLPEGELQLSVAHDGVVVYEGPVRILPPLPVPVEPEPVPEPVRPPPAPDPPGPAAREQPVTFEDLSPTVFQEVDLGPPSVPMSTPGHGARVSSATPTELPAAGAPFRVVLSGENLAAELLDRLSVQVEAGGARAEQQLRIATGEGLTYLFVPPSGGWNGAVEGRIRVSDPRGEVEDFEQALGVAGAEPRTGPQQPPPHPQSGEPPRMTPTEPAAEPQAADKAPAATPPGDPTTPATGQLQLLPLGEPAWIDSMGFELSLALAGSEPSGADWNRAELATQHALLAPNVAKFTPKAELAQRDGRRVLTLRFTRNTAELPDLAYDVLVADLVESSPVGLRIGWPQLGVALEVPAQFKRPDAPDADGEDADDAEL